MAAMAALKHLHGKSLEWFRDWLHARNGGPIERFCETILRVYVPVGVLVCLLSIPSVILYDPGAASLGDALYDERWWLLYFTAALLTHLLCFLALRRNNLRSAVRWMIGSYFVLTCGIMLVADVREPVVYQA